MKQIATFTTNKIKPRIRALIFNEGSCYDYVMVETRQIRTPQGRRAWKIPLPETRSPLLYLGWGARQFGQDPVPLSQTLGYIYSIVLEGCPKFQQPEQSIACPAGTLLILDRDCPFGWSDAAGATSKLLVWTWQEQPQIAALVAPSCSYLKWQVDAKHLSTMETLHKNCRHELSIADQHSALSLYSMQRQIDVVWARLISRPEQQTEQNRYELSLNWMRQNLAVSQPISSLCDYLQLSEPTLHRIFARRAGRSPLNVFQKLKIEQANTLLAQKLPVKAVAFALGYRHPNDFSRFYRKATGHTPSQSPTPPFYDPHD
jgi:AraC-like DNA-binding protein